MLLWFHWMSSNFGLNLFEKPEATECTLLCRFQVRWSYITPLSFSNFYNSISKLYSFPLNLTSAILYMLTNLLLVLVQENFSAIKLMTSKRWVMISVNNYAAEVAFCTIIFNCAKSKMNNYKRRQFLILPE